jgi:putative ABC transport system permease protein
MNFLEHVKMAVQTLLAHKMRSSLTMLGIIIGNASVIGMVGAGEGARKFVSQQIDSFGPNVLFVLPGSPEAQSRPVYHPQTLILEDAIAIAEQVLSIKEVAASITGIQLIYYRGKKCVCGFIGSDSRVFDSAEF